MKFKLALIAVLMGSCTNMPAIAQNNATRLDLTKQTAETFQVQIDEIHKAMQQGGRFEYIHDDDREVVDNNLKIMLALIEKNDTVANMKDEDRINLFNHQERVNSLLTKNDSQRIVCDKAQHTGSLFKATTCQTFAQLEKRRRESQDTIERTQLNQTSFRGVSGSPPVVGH